MSRLRIGAVADRCTPPHRVVLEYEETDVELYVRIMRDRHRASVCVLDADGIEALGKLVRRVTRWLKAPAATRAAWERQQGGRGKQA